jgi:23S rRNA pseudouridine2605 synthase
MPVTLGQKINTETDTIHLDTNPVVLKIHEKVYILLNKPKGYVTTASDELADHCYWTSLYRLRTYFPVAV